MKFKEIFFVSFFFLTINLYSSDYDRFKSENLSSIKDFTQDLSKVLSVGTLNSARALGFGGFAINYNTICGIKPNRNDTVYDKNKVYGLNFLQAEIGLPYRIDAYVRGGGDSNFNAIGFGVRYGITNVSDEYYKLNMMISLGSNVGIHRYFYIVNYNAQLAFSMNLTNVIRPFLTAGFSHSRLNAKTSDYADVSGRNIYKDFPFYTAGMRLKFKWFNIAFAYDIFEKEDGFNTSIGFRF